MSISGKSKSAMLPAEAHLAMPIQNLYGNPPGAREVLTSPHSMLLKRLLLIALTAVIGLAASSTVRMELSRDGLDLIEVVLLLFFVPLFCWISFGFVTSTIGFFKLITGEHPGFTALPSPASSLCHRTAVLMPVYNESVTEVFARARAMAHSIAASGGAPWIDFFILSDSNPSHGKEEEEAWRVLAAEAPINVYYRRREKNTARKPGNISEWVQRFGAAYECMLVLDADSMMSGDTIVGMASIMEERPSIGLLQTVPMITNARTLFQRWMQFASEAYGPIASAGLLWWSGAESNFWGHNAIVRTRAFAESCGLPELPGKAPFGGHILSHDMLESALLRRRGWAVHMVMIGGSYEEFPPSIVDMAIRDRRWMQGNLQHLQLLGASGLHWVHRLHLLIGASAYLTSPGWLLLILTMIGQAATQGTGGFVTLAPPSVLALTVLLLFGPKLMGTIWMLASRERRQAFGGASAILRTLPIEIVLSMLLAPVTMVTQTKALLNLLLGISSGWNTQTRDARRIHVFDVLPNLREHLLLGFALSTTIWIDPITTIWLLPIIIGLFSAPWLISITSSETLGQRAHAAKFFRVPAPGITESPAQRLSVDPSLPLDELKNPILAEA